MSTIRPCIHPWCARNDRDPELTRDVMCKPCRRHYRRELDWLVLDYVIIKSTLPTPVARGSTLRRSRSTSFGHPAEWASDRVELIAAALNRAEDALRENLHHRPALGEKVSEVRRVNAAHHYLTDHFEELVTYPDARDTAVHLHDLHQQNRSALGLTRFYERLPFACPACDTGKALLRMPGLIKCGECHHETREEHYGLLARKVLDALINEYDARHAQTEELA